MYSFFGNTSTHVAAVRDYPLVHEFYFYVYTIRVLVLAWYEFGKKCESEREGEREIEKYRSTVVLDAYNIYIFSNLCWHHWHIKNMASHVIHTAEDGKPHRLHSTTAIQMHEKKNSEIPCVQSNTQTKINGKPIFTIFSWQSYLEFGTAHFWP